MPNSGVKRLNMILNCNQSGILQQRTQNVELKKYCVKLLEGYGSLHYTKQALEGLETELRTEVAKHGGNPLLVDMLDELLARRKWVDENQLVQ
jgi:hypothetical protein